MLVTLEGMVMLVRPVQLENADLPMVVTLSGMVMLVRPKQPSNELLPMLVTFDGISVFLQPKMILLVEVSIMALQLFLLSYIVFPV